MSRFNNSFDRTMNSSFGSRAPEFGKSLGKSDYNFEIDKEENQSQAIVEASSFNLKSELLFNTPL